MDSSLMLSPLFSCEMEDSIFASTENLATFGQQQASGPVRAERQQCFDQGPSHGMQYCS